MSKDHWDAILAARGVGKGSEVDRRLTLPIELDPEEKGNSMSDPSERDWQPIETAPKDGRWMLAHPRANTEAVHVMIVAWRPEHAGNTHPWVGEGQHSAWYVSTFTHWQPLPAPPEASP